MPQYLSYTNTEYENLLDRFRILRQALEDIAGADETSTLEGAVAIAVHALKEVE
jgi:hypothetical protein